MSYIADKISGDHVGNWDDSQSIYLFDCAKLQPESTQDFLVQMQSKANAVSSSPHPAQPLEGVK